MVDEVGEVESSWAPPPARFEAGSPNLADAIGFAAADYVTAIGISTIRAFLRNLADCALQSLQSIPGVEIYGPPEYGQRAGIISFKLEGVHPHDMAQIAGEMGGGAPSWPSLLPAIDENTRRRRRSGQVSPSTTMRRT